MTPEQAVKLQEALQAAAGKLADLEALVYGGLGEDSLLIEDLRMALISKVSPDVLLSFATRCEEYFED